MAYCIGCDTQHDPPVHCGDCGTAAPPEHDTGHYMRRSCIAVIGNVLREIKAEWFANQRP